MSDASRPVRLLPAPNFAFKKGWTEPLPLRVRIAESELAVEVKK